MQITIHQTQHSIADFKNIFDYLKSHFSEANPGIHLFPELFLCGYPLQDLCLQKSFISKYTVFLAEIQAWFKEQTHLSETCLLMGGLEYDLSQSGVPKSIKNTIYEFSSESNGVSCYTKQLLPNYDIFDEQKYFTRGSESFILEKFGKRFGLLICEDMWSSSFHDLDPVNDLLELSKQTKPLDAIFNLSASPFLVGKQKSRLLRAKEISCQFGCPFYYANRVSGEDEILFDGQSFVVNQEEIISQGLRFLPQVIPTQLPARLGKSTKKNSKVALTWEELFTANLDLKKSPATLHVWTDDECAEVIEALCFGLQEYVNKNNFKHFSLALSGGLDSALVLTLICLSLKKGQTVEAIYMPSVYSSSLSHELSLELCTKLAVKLTTLPIKFLHSTAKNLFSQSFSEPFEGLTDENIQSRLRGLLLYTRSNQKNSIIINTSNKSEIAVGYSTQYGDSVGAVSLLGDVYKSQVYRLCEYINQKYKNIIPARIIERPPTAELKENQSDTDSLPPYELLDSILEGILSYRYNAEDLQKIGFKQEDIELTLKLYARNEYKRYQFCPILKINSKSFGFGYRIPLSKNSDFY